MTDGPFDLSVVIPAQNEAGYIEAALRSVYDQRYPRDRLEAVVVANGCTDTTVDVVRAWAAEHPDLAVVLLESDPPGIAHAKNTGAAAAWGPVLLFMDADSRMPPSLAGRIVDDVRSGTVISTVRIVADSDDLLDRLFYWLIEIGKFVLRAHANFFFVRREFFLESGGYDPDFGFAEDLDYLQRLKRSGVRVRHMRNPAIPTSPRRLRRGPLRLGWLVTILRWAAIRFGIGRKWRY